MNRDKAHVSRFAGLLAVALASAKDIGELLHIPRGAVLVALGIAEIYLVLRMRRNCQRQRAHDGEGQ